MFSQYCNTSSIILKKALALLDMFICFILETCGVHSDDMSLKPLNVKHLVLSTRLFVFSWQIEFSDLCVRVNNVVLITLIRSAPPCHSVVVLHAGRTGYL